MNKKIYTYCNICTFRMVVLMTFLVSFQMLQAQSCEWGKLSSMLRRTLRMEQQKMTDGTTGTRSTRNAAGRRVMALVKCEDEGILEREGCKVWRSWGDIHATSIPANRLAALSGLPEVRRIEAGRSCQVCVDTTATLLGVDVLREGLPGVPGLTGRGVVLGIQDIGFDLTHPTFYSRDLQEYRIKAFWDMLDPDTLESKLFVGRDYVRKEDILKKAHATDGLKQTHGVHTAGIAGGSGYDSPYVGMAPETDLCFVANAVGSDAEFISEEDMMKYTSATDIMGFQYILDYAERVGKPCVISFSEGAHEDLYGDAQLLYEVLERMTGPGRIIVASAGNSSVNKTYLHKPIGTDSTSSFLYSNSDVAYYTLRHSDKTEVQLHFSEASQPGRPLLTRSVDTDQICAMEDSLLMDTMLVGEERFLLLMASYPSCYNPNEWATELYIQSLDSPQLGMGSSSRVRLTLMGKDDDVECFASGGLFLNISSLPQYHTAVSTHNINFPAAAPCVIAVGGTAYRTGAWNYDCIWKNYDMGNDGRRWLYSSVGPTMQGLIKPDVMAPACNIISGYSSYYIEANPKANDVDWDVSHFQFQGRTYGWNCNSGTSMSSPVVGGVIALWLQLCPTLSPDQAMEVIRQTSRQYDPLLPYPNNEYGWGEIDALAGAKYIQEHFECVDLTTIEEVTEEANSKEGVSEVFDLNGRRVNDLNPKRGLYLIKYIDGSVKKVLR